MLPSFWSIPGSTHADILLLTSLAVGPLNHNVPLLFILETGPQQTHPYPRDFAHKQLSRLPSSALTPATCHTSLEGNSPFYASSLTLQKGIRHQSWSSVQLLGVSVDISAFYFQVGQPGGLQTLTAASIP